MHTHSDEPATDPKKIEKGRKKKKKRLVNGGQQTEHRTKIAFVSINNSVPS